MLTGARVLVSTSPLSSLRRRNFFPLPARPVLTAVEGERIEVQVLKGGPLWETYESPR